MRARTIIVVLIAGCSGRSLDEPCPEGFDGRDAIDAVHSPLTGTFTTKTGNTAYTLAADYHSGSIECVRTETHEGCVGPVTTPAHVNVDVLVTFSTDDGMFANMPMAGTLTLEKQGSVTLQASTKVAKGSFVSPLGSCKSDSFKLLLNVAVTSTKTSGTLLAQCVTGSNSTSTQNVGTF